MTSRPRFFTFWCVLLVFIFTSCATHSVSLPDLGNESRLNLTETQEKLVGTSWMQQIRASGLVNADPLLHDYLNYLGHTLTAHTPRSQTYTFFWIQQLDQNAFTFFGGHIGVHFGMLTHVEDESQLAAVIAHELAHTSQQHLLRQITQNRRALPITLAQAAAAIALGQPNLVIAAMAGHGQKMINYTRQNEKEADRIGMQILANAGYDPQSMPQVFSTMSKTMRYHDTPSEYLLTHPLFENRITDAEHRASRYPYRQKANSELFYFAKERVEVLSADDLNALVNHYQTRLEQKRYAHPAALEYGLALAYQKMGHPDQAKKILLPLTKQYPHQFPIHLALAQIELVHQPKKALSLIQPFLKTHQYHTALLLLHAEIKLLLNQPAKARRILKKNEVRLEQLPDTYDLLIRIESKLNNQTGRLAAQAEQFALFGELDKAYHTLSQAIEISGSDKNISRLTQRRKEIEALLVASRKF